jgi:hypothetical protein
MHVTTNLASRIVLYAGIGVSFLALIATTACIQSPTGSAASFALTAAHRTPQSSSVDRTELSALETESLYDALQRLRPEWFRVNPSSREPVELRRAVVYIDQVYYGELNELSLVPVAAVTGIRYLAPSQARHAFGSTCVCAGGVVLVLTRRSSAASSQPAP